MNQTVFFAKFLNPKTLKYGALGARTVLGYNALNKQKQSHDIDLSHASNFVSAQKAEIEKTYNQAIINYNKGLISATEFVNIADSLKKEDKKLFGED